jgi:hypothetical protein
MQKNQLLNCSTKKNSHVSRSVDTSLTLFQTIEKKLNKKTLSIQSPGPGPGQYSLPSSQSGPKFSIYGKLQEKSFTVSPGPGTYILPRDRVICAKFSPPRVKQSLEGWEKLGPGSYTPLITSSSPKWGFGGSNRSKLNISDSPGPGSYDVPSFSLTKGFSFYPKRQERSAAKSPGPGSYEPRFIERSLKFSLYPRIAEKLTQQTPGPGAYSPYTVGVNRGRGKISRVYKFF